MWENLHHYPHPPPPSQSQILWLLTLCHRRQSQKNPSSARSCACHALQPQYPNPDHFTTACFHMQLPPFCPLPWSPALPHTGGSFRPNPTAWPLVLSPVSIKLAIKACLIHCPWWRAICHPFCPCRQLISEVFWCIPIPNQPVLERPSKTVTPKVVAETSGHRPLTDEKLATGTSLSNLQTWISSKLNSSYLSACIHCLHQLLVYCWDIGCCDGT